MMTMGAFVAGVVVGWVGRGLHEAPRRELVGSVEKGFGLLASGKRWVAERVEWVEDVIAEGRARYEGSIGEGSLGEAPAIEGAAEEAT